MTNKNDVISYYFANGRLLLPKEHAWENADRFCAVQPYSYTISVRDAEAMPEADAAFVINDNARISRVDSNGKKGWLISAEKDEDKLTKGYSYCCFIDEAYENAEVCCQITRPAIRCAYDAILPMHEGTALHASCVKYGDHAICFCGPSGAGKSTHAYLWKDLYGAPMISSDTPAVFPLKDGGAMAYGMPWDGSDQIILQDSVKVKAVVELRQAKYNSMRRLSDSQAFRMLLKQGHMPMWDEEAMFAEMLVLKKLAKAVPFYRLNCLPEASAAELVRAVVFGNSTGLHNLGVCEEEIEMKVKDGFVLREVMGEHIVMPTGDNMKKFEGALVLSSTSAFVWEKLQNNVSRSDILQDVMAEFDVDETTASADIDALIEKLKSFDVLEEFD